MVLLLRSAKVGLEKEMVGLVAGGGGYLVSLLLGEGEKTQPGIGRSGGTKLARIRFFAISRC